jgi:PTS system nitrogen regulatory IIA component
MGTLAQGLQLVQNKDEFIRKLMERENMMSTAIGPGIALPHLRNPSPIVINGPRILIGRSKAGVQFDSLDGKPTYLFVMILSDSETVHLRVTAKIAKILRRENLRQQLLSFDYSRQFVEFFIRMEHEFFHPDDLMKPNQ